MHENAGPVIHVAFGDSAAGSLRKAMRMLKRDDEVLALVDDLAWGPLDPADARVREAWRAEQLGYGEDAQVIALVEGFWSRVEAHRGEIVAWLSRNSATEYCGFLALRARVHAPVSMIDVAAVAFVDRDGAPSPDTSIAFGLVREDQIVEHGLRERAVCVSSTARDAYVADWQRLRRENAPVRVMTATGLVSAPISYFDDLILASVTREWQRCARVVGAVLYELSEGRYRQGGGDALPFSRLLALIEEGVLEAWSEQEVPTMRELWVRRSARPSLRRI